MEPPATSENTGSLDRGSGFLQVAILHGCRLLEVGRVGRMAEPRQDRVMVRAKGGQHLEAHQREFVPSGHFIMVHSRWFKDRIAKLEELDGARNDLHKKRVSMLVTRYQNAHDGMIALQQ